MTMDQLKQLAALAPDLPLGQAVPVLEWIAEFRFSSGEGEKVNSVQGEGDAVADPAPASATEVAASVAEAPSSRRGASWSEEEIARAWSLKKAGHTVSDIASRLGRPTAATGQMFKRQRIMGHDMATEGQKYRPWTPEDLAHARAMKVEGKTYGQIAAHFGRSPEATRVALARPRNTSAPKIPQQEAPDAEPAAPSETPGDTGDSSGMRLVADGGGSGSEPAPAADHHRTGVSPVPGLAAAGGAAAGADEQHPGLVDLGGVDVADAPRVEPAAVAPAPRPTGLSMRQGWLLDHLDGLPADFTAEDDLFLIQELMAGTPPAVVADQLGRELKAVAGRFRSMQTEEILTVRGQLTLSGQQDLLAAARHRAQSHA